MISAFGVEHGDVISKGGIGLIPKAIGGGGIRMGGPTTMKNAAVKGFQRGRKQGSNILSASLRGASGAIKSSPGTLAAAGTGIGVVGGTGAYMNRN